MNLVKLKRRFPIFPLLFIVLILLPIVSTSCGKSKDKTPFELLQDSLRQQGDSIIVSIDTTQVIVLHNTPDGPQLQSVSIDNADDQKFGIVADFIKNDSVLIYINKETGKQTANSLDLNTLEVSPIANAAETISFTANKDSLIFTNGNRTLQTDLTGKSKAIIEPGVTTACMNTYKRVNNYTDNSAGYWGLMYNQPLSFAGYKGKFTCWEGSKFYGFMKTDQGTIVFKRNGDTYLDDQKIGTTKMSVSSKYFDGGQYNTRTTVTGRFTALDGTTDSFSLSIKSFTP